MCERENERFVNECVCVLKRENERCVWCTLVVRSSRTSKLLGGTLGNILLEWNANL